VRLHWVQGRQSPSTSMDRVMTFLGEEAATRCGAGLGAVAFTRPSTRVREVQWRHKSTMGLRDLLDLDEMCVRECVWLLSVERCEFAKRQHRM
jgi:hypothetical protein